ncbi:hypothetical protein ACFFNY_23935 [Paenibacillus hodogayensis]|uniref:Lipoprotein n=1 Tax=Paenibacillus hodogayensis TaxID=279208 RepID=A0ABV5W2H8_9BACL
MRKRLVTLASLTLALGLAACNGTPSTSTDANGNVNAAKEPANTNAGQTSGSVQTPPADKAADQSGETADSGNAETGGTPATGIGKSGSDGPQAGQEQKTGTDQAAAQGERKAGSTNGSQPDANGSSTDKRPVLAPPTRGENEPAVVSGGASGGSTRAEQLAPVPVPDKAEAIKPEALHGKPRQADASLPLSS